MKINKNDLCVCGHFAYHHMGIMASKYVKIQKGQTEYLACDWSDAKYYGDDAIWGVGFADDSWCSCNLFKLDNLEYLRKKHESKKQA